MSNLAIYCKPPPETYNTYSVTIHLNDNMPLAKKTERELQQCLSSGIFFKLSDFDDFCAALIGLIDPTAKLPIFPKYQERVNKIKQLLNDITERKFIQKAIKIKIKYYVNLSDADKAKIIANALLVEDALSHYVPIPQVNEFFALKSLQYILSFLDLLSPEQFITYVLTTDPAFKCILQTRFSNNYEVIVRKLIDVLNHALVNLDEKFIEIYQQAINLSFPFLVKYADINHLSDYAPLIDVASNLVSKMVFTKRLDCLRLVNKKPKLKLAIIETLNVEDYVAEKSLGETKDNELCKLAKECFFESQQASTTFSEMERWLIFAVYFMSHISDPSHLTAADNLFVGIHLTEIHRLPFLRFQALEEESYEEACSITDWLSEIARTNESLYLLKKGIGHLFICPLPTASAFLARTLQLQSINNSATNTRLIINPKIRLISRQSAFCETLRQHIEDNQLSKVNDLLENEINFAKLLTETEAIYTGKTNYYLEWLIKLQLQAKSFSYILGTSIRPNLPSR